MPAPAAAQPVEHNATMALDPDQIVSDDAPVVAAPIPSVRRELPAWLQGRRGKIIAAVVVILTIGLIARLVTGSGDGGVPPQPSAAPTEEPAAAPAADPSSSSSAREPEPAAEPEAAAPAEPKPEPKPAATAPAKARAKSSSPPPADGDSSSTKKRPRPNGHFN